MWKIKQRKMVHRKAIKSNKFKIVQIKLKLINTDTTDVNI